MHSTAQQHSTAAQPAQHPRPTTRAERAAHSTQHTAHRTTVPYTAVITDTLPRVTLSGRTKSEQQPHRILWKGFLASAGDSKRCRFRAM
jgi:hypothetical protein